MEVDVQGKLAVARQNAEALLQERDRLNTLYLKWVGAVEYLESLSELAKPAQGDPSKMDEAASPPNGKVSEMPSGKRG